MSSANPTIKPATGAASAFTGDGLGGAERRTAPINFAVPGFYGRGPRGFTAGEGRLARPRFRVFGRASVGYDDNVFQTPTNARGTPDQEIQVLETPAVAPTQRLEAVPSGDPNIPDETRVVTVPGQAATFRTETIRGTPAPERIGSFLTRAEIDIDVQMASRRSLLTFDLNTGADYYFDRPGDQLEYHGELEFLYLYKLTGRAQVTASASASYQSQPDFSQPNLPTSTNNRGSFLSANAKLDLSYRLTPRLSTVTSLSYSALYSVEESDQATDFGETTFGTELRYLFSPRLTLLGELRYSSSLHQQNSALDQNTYFLLAGGELTLSRRFLATLRVGEALQTYAESGGKGSSPYVEATVNYRLARGTTLEWNARYGFEQSGATDTETIVARSGLTLTQIFSPRLQGALTLNLVQNTTTSTSEMTIAADPEPVAEPTPAPAVSTSTSTTTPAAAPAATPRPTPAPTPAPVRTRRVTTENVQNTIDSTLSLKYTLSRRWSFNLSYSYTMVIGPEEESDYYRQRVFFGGEYLF